jgi:hypothetical protein
MDINRLIRIANHFDKIGAYTISDEFENKFIRTAAPVDEKLIGRNPKVNSRSAVTNVSSVIDFFSKFRTKTFDLAKRTPQDILNFNQDSWNLLVTWQYAFNTFKSSPFYAEPKKNKLVNDILTELFVAESNFKNARPAAIGNGAKNDRTRNEIERFANDEQTLLQIFAQFVDGENAKYQGGQNTKYYPYLNNLRIAENALYNLDMLASNGTPLPSVSSTQTKPTPGSSGTPAPSGGGTAATPGGASSSGSASPSSSSSGSSTAPSGGGNAPSPSTSGNRPSSTPAPSGRTQSVPSGSTQSGTGGGTSTKPSTKPTSTKSTSTKPGKLKEDNANLELSKIVFRKYQAAHPKVEKSDILLNMRLVNDFKLKTYFDITKDPSLDGSIRAAIKASPYSQYFKDTMLKIYESKLKAAKEVNSEPVTPVADTPTTPSDSGETKTDTKTETKTEEKKDDDFGFRCSREGLFTEIGRMDTLHNNDPDKYIRSYFGDIKRVIDCHESIRNSLNHKDNIQLDTLINILEAKYFSLINKTQFPY